MPQPLTSDDPSSNDRSLIAHLALYLLLLAFFILLNTLTHPDESRARDVIRSVQEAFDHEVLAVRPVGEQEAEVGAAVAAAQAAEELLAALASQDPEVSKRSVAGSTVLRLELDAEPLFPEEGEVLRPAAVTLLEGVAAALKRQIERGVYVETEILNGVATLQSDRRENLAEAWHAGRRATALVRALIARDLAGDRMAGGVLPGRPGRLQIVFHFFDQPPKALDPGIGRPAGAPQ